MRKNTSLPMPLRKRPSQFEHLKYIYKAFDFSSKLTLLWASSNRKARNLQYLLFPEGVVLATKDDTVRTPTISQFFEWLAGQQGDKAQNENRQTIFRSDLPSQGGMVKSELTDHRSGRNNNA